MSQENVAVVRRVYEVWKAGDTDAFRELCHRDIIMRTPEDWPEPGPFVGREAVMHVWHQVREAWDAAAVEPISEFIEADDLVVVRQVGLGVGSGPVSHLELTNVFRLRKGKIIYQEFVWDHAEGLKAAGLA